MPPGTPAWPGGVVIGDAPLGPAGEYLTGQERAVIAGERRHRPGPAGHRVRLEEMDVPDLDGPGALRPARDVFGPRHDEEDGSGFHEDGIRDQHWRGRGSR